MYIFTINTENSENPFLLNLAFLIQILAIFNISDLYVFAMSCVYYKCISVVFKRRKRGTYRAMGPRELLDVCEHIVKHKGNWKYNIR